MPCAKMHANDVRDSLPAIIQRESQFVSDDAGTGFPQGICIAVGILGLPTRGTLSIPGPSHHYTSSCTTNFDCHDISLNFVEVG